MSNKTEDQIEKERQAVTKMIGAKGAMEQTLSRISTLERALDHIRSLSDDLRRKIGDDLYVKTFYHGENGDGEKTVRASDQLRRIEQIVDKVK